MYIKAEELGLKENHGIQKTGIEDFYGNITVHQRQVMKIWENYITELYDWSNQLGNLEVKPKEEVDKVDKALTSCTVKQKMLPRSWWIRL